MDCVGSDSTDTLGLLTQIQGGRSEAVDRLLARYRDYLRGIIDVRMDPRLRSRVDVSDVVQETQLEVAQRLPDFLKRRPMPFRLWLRKTAMERLLREREQHVTAKRRTVTREVPLPFRSSMQLAARMLGKVSTPSERASRRELVQGVRGAIAQLPDIEREIVLMMDFENLTSREAAAVLGFDASTVRRRHGRALIRLHQLLRKGGLTESQI